MNTEDSSNEMEQNETQSSLNQKQMIAMETLLEGRTATDAAKSANVNRTTIHRWRKDPVFIAEYNRRCKEQQDAAFTHMQSVVLKAITTVENSIDQGDSRVALALLKGMGFLNGVLAEIGWDDPERVAHEQHVAERRRDESELMDTMLYRL